jgi:hypothetical protein
MGTAEKTETVKRAVYRLVKQSIKNFIRHRLIFRYGFLFSEIGYSFVDGFSLDDNVFCGKYLYALPDKPLFMIECPSELDIIEQVFSLGDDDD